MPSLPTPSTPRLHPSSPIPNAAYPDSSYRPPNLTLPHPGHDRDPEEKAIASTPPRSTAFSDLPEVLYPPTSASPPSANYSRAGAASPSGSPSRTARANPPPALWTPDSFLAMNPNLPPPPPYSSSRPGTSHSLHSYAEQPPSPSASQHSHTPLRPFAAPSVQSIDSPSLASPLRPLQPAAHRPGMLQLSPGHMGGPSGMAGPSPMSAHSPGGPGVGEFGPTAAERKKRIRRWKMTILACVVAFLFLIALIVGIAVGVLKVGLDHRERPPPPPPPPFSSPTGVSDRRWVTW